MLEICLPVELWSYVRTVHIIIIMGKKREPLLGHSTILRVLRSMRCDLCPFLRPLRRAFLRDLPIGQRHPWARDMRQWGVS